MSQLQFYIKDEKIFTISQKDAALIVIIKSHGGRWLPLQKQWVLPIRQLQPFLESLKQANYTFEEIPQQLNVNKLYESNANAIKEKERRKHILLALSIEEAKMDEILHFIANIEMDCQGCSIGAASQIRHKCCFPNNNTL